VSPEDPLPHHPKIVSTPHLGASTLEAQTNVAIQVAEEVLGVLNGLPPQFAVNAPNMRAEEGSAVQPYVTLARMLGKAATQLADGRVKSAEITYRGEAADRNVSVITVAATQGLLEPITESETPVNVVNAKLLAQQRGLDVSETKSSAPDSYTNSIRVSVRTDQGVTSVVGTVSGGLPYIVQIGEYSLHLEPTPGYQLVTQHTDRPGIIGLVGTLLGESDINISSMHVGREAPRGQALMVLSVDDPIPAAAVERLRTAANISYIRVIKL
jgi:D-3-phosphoglycerate dehydrogenase